MRSVYQDLSFVVDTLNIEVLPLPAQPKEPSLLPTYQPSSVLPTDQQYSVLPTDKPFSGEERSRRDTHRMKRRASTSSESSEDEGEKHRKSTPQSEIYHEDCINFKH